MQHTSAEKDMFYDDLKPLSVGCCLGGQLVGKFFIFMIGVSNYIYYVVGAHRASDLAPECLTLLR